MILFLQTKQLIRAMIKEFKTCWRRPLFMKGVNYFRGTLGHAFNQIIQPYLQ